jgi:CheY-like chemotaxis protein
VRHGRGAVVLLVDDDSAVREVTASILAELGYKVVEAGSGGAALELFDRRPDIALVLLDFAMPGMNGAEVARELRARRPDVPILFATGYADTAALAVLGEDELIQKPFVESEVATKLAARLEARVQREPV